MRLAEQYQSFISWQCRLRKLSMREKDGQPSAGMSAGIRSVSGGDEQARINFLINRKESADRTSEFRHIIRKTHDSREWVKNGLRILAERHYHETDQFEPELTALFSDDSSTADALLKAGECQLRFAEGSIEHEFNFGVRSLDQDDAQFQSTYWHNRLFNPALPGKVRVLGFKPCL